MGQNRNEVTVIQSRNEVTIITPQPIKGFITPSLTPTEQKKDIAFSTIRQGPATNELTKARARVGINTIIDAITNRATVTQGDLTISISDEMMHGLKPQTYRLLDALTVEFTERGSKSPIITLPVRKFMDKCELKDIKETRKQITDALETLFNARFSFKDKKLGKDSQDFVDVRICDAVGIKNGVITFSLSNLFFNLMTGYPVMAYPEQLFRLNPQRNPNSYYMLRKIAELKNMNVAKKNEDVIAVKTLVENAPALPSYEEVKSGNRNFTKRIIDPFERDMNALSDTLTWQYCHKNNTPLTDEELMDFSYELFIELLVKVQWNDYPDQTARLKAQAEKRKKRRPSKKKMDKGK